MIGRIITPGSESLGHPRDPLCVSNSGNHPGSMEESCRKGRRWAPSQRGPKGQAPLRDRSQQLHHHRMTVAASGMGFRFSVDENLPLPLPAERNQAAPTTTTSKVRRSAVKPLLTGDRVSAGVVQKCQPKALIASWAPWNTQGKIPPNDCDGGRQADGETAKHVNPAFEGGERLNLKRPQWLRSHRRSREKVPHRQKFNT